VNTTLSAKTKNVLFITPRFIGDAVVLTGLLRELHRRRPELNLYVYSPAGAIPLLEGLPFIQGVHAASSRKADLTACLHNWRIDTTVLLRFSLSDAFQLGQCGIPQRIGFAYQRISKTCYLPTSFGLTHALPYTGWKAGNTQHHLAFLASILTLFTGETLPAEALYPELAPISDVLRHEATTLRQTAYSQHAVPTDAPYVVLHLAAASQEKGISDAQILPSLLMLLEQHPYAILCTGLHEHQPRYEQLRTMLPHEHRHRLINMAGVGSLQQLQAWLSEAQGLLGLDSAPAHIATAVGTPRIVTWFGAVPSHVWHAMPREASQRWAVVETRPQCKPCLAKQCEHNACRTSITGLQGRIAVEGVFAS
jgi:ADP-heptose:LPS heptosyltransferase